MEADWQYLLYFVAGAALLVLFHRMRGRGGMKGQGYVALSIFVVLGVLLVFHALGRAYFG